MSRTIQWCDGPTPSASRPPATACTDSAWRASAIGCWACSGTTAVPSSMREVCAAISATMVSASKSLGTCGIHAVSMPADSAHSMSDDQLARPCAPYRRARPRSSRRVSSSSTPLRPPGLMTPRLCPSARARRAPACPAACRSGNTAAAPASSSFCTSACGMVPPTTTAMSPASAARSASTVRVVSATCAPDRIESPPAQRLPAARSTRCPRCAAGCRCR